MNLPNTLTTSNENAEIGEFEVELVAAWNGFGSFGQSGEKMKYSPFDPIAEPGPVPRFGFSLDPHATQACGLAVAWTVKA